jgi:hypothetical protein
MFVENKKSKRIFLAYSLSSHYPLVIQQDITNK